ncbi:DUF427 domain-containing protein [Halomonas sp. YLGW01]|uniref:DUF427 domain-containing protein n=1 Tax=Halomonas sp. YLGW01 TaxID=2773308 RepID=UPI00177E854B|nr:DUF427 domain-containing protein [Halomonas sp. YLGW01]
MSDSSSDPRITLHPHPCRVRIYSNDNLIASAIELRESGYPHWSDLKRELPKTDVDMAKLSISPTVAHCPFKGDSVYYSLPNINDIALSYEKLIEEMKAIVGRLACSLHKSLEITGISIPFSAP